MEANSIVLVAYGFFGITALLSVVRWSGIRRSIPQDGRLRAARGEADWHSHAAVKPPEEEAAKATSV